MPGEFQQVRLCRAHGQGAGADAEFRQQSGAQVERDDVVAEFRERDRLQPEAAA